MLFAGPQTGTDIVHLCLEQDMNCVSLAAGGPVPLDHVPDIVPLRARLEMRRVTADWIVALMPDH